MKTRHFNFSDGKAGSRAVARRRLLSRAMLVCEALEPRKLLSAAFPTNDEQYMLQVINRARMDPTAEVALWSGNTWGDSQMPSDPNAPYFPEPQPASLNEGLPANTITADAKQPLAFNPLLEDGAQKHSQWMTNNDMFSHYEGTLSPFDRMDAEGYTGYYTAGENIAARTINSGQSVSSVLLQQEGDLFVDNDESSSDPAGQRGHRQNLMNPDFKEVGVGAVVGPLTYSPGSGQLNSVLVTEDFGARTGDSFLTGVAYNDLNQNNFYDPGEGLGGVTITATRTSDHQAFSTTTWGSGGYTLQLSPGTYSVLASGGMIGAPAPVTVVMGALNIEQDFNPVIAPAQLLSATIGDGTAQRSEVRKVTLQFNQPVTLGSGAVTLSLLNTGRSGANDGSAPTDVSAALATPATTDGGLTWTYTFQTSDSAVVDSTSSLKDGIYTLTVNPASVTGGTLTGTNLSTTFHRLFGDIDGNGTVNSADYFKFKNAFGSKVGQLTYNPNFDFDGNGSINSSDYFKFKANFGKKFTY